MGFNVREASNAKRLKDEEEKKNKFDVKKASEDRKKLNINTFSDDLNATNEKLNSIVGGWQDADTMASSRNEISKMYDRIKLYNSNRESFGADLPDLTELSDYYKNVLDEWDSRAEMYGGYENADAYNKAVEATRKKAEADAAYNKRVREANLLEENSELAYWESILRTAKTKKAEADSKEDDYISDIDAGDYNDTSRSRGRAGASRRNNKEFRNYMDSIGYSSIDDLEKAIAEKKSFISDATIIQDERKALNSEDFEKFVEIGKAQEFKDLGLSTVGNKVEHFKQHPTAMKGQLSTVTDEYTLRDKPELALAAYGTEEEQSIYNFYLGQESEGIADKGTADRYIETIMPRLEEKWQNEKLTNLDKLASGGFWSKAGASALSVGHSLLGAGEYIVDSIDYAKTGEMDDNFYARASSTIRGRVSEDVDWKIDALDGWDAFDFVYNTGMSAIDSATVMWMPGGMGNAVLGLSAAGQGVNDALDRGLSNDQAFWQGFASGAFEMAFEKLSIGNFKAFKDMPVDGWKTAFKNLGKTMFVNASEEMLTEFANIMYDTIAHGDLSQYEMRVQELLDSDPNMSEAEAKRKAALEFGAQIGEAGLSGGFMGLVFGSVGNAGASINTNSIGKSITANNNVDKVFNMAQISPEASAAYEAYTNYANKGISADNAKAKQVGALSLNLKQDAVDILNDSNSTEAEKAKAEQVLRDLDAYSQNTSVSRFGKDKVKELFGDKEKTKALIDNALTKGEGTEAHKIATELQKKLDSGKELSEKELTKLVDVTTSEVKDTVRVDAEQKLRELGETENAVELSKIISKAATGQMLSSAETEAIANNENARKVFAEMDKSSNIELMETSEAYEGGDAELFLENYEGGDIDKYRASFDFVSSLAKNNYDADFILEHRGALTPRQVQNIYSKVVAEPRAEQQRKLDELVKNHEGQLVRKANIDDSIFNGAKGQKLWRNLNSRQKKAITFVKAFAKGAGINLKITYDGKYKGKAYNGYYDHDTNTIVIDARAGFDRRYISEDAIIPTMSHELTHWMKQKSPELYAKLSKQIFDVFKAKGYTEYDLIATEQRKHPDMSDDAARDEIIARASEDLFKMSEEGKKIFDSLSEAEKKTLTEKIKKIIRNLIDWANELLGLYESKSQEAGWLREFQDELSEIAKTWDQMLAQAVEVNAALEGEGTTGEALSKEITDAQLSEKETITQDAIDALRSIGRKSVNEFTSEDIKKAEPFARRMFKELRAKSPFFRAWFGDWRVNDITPISPVEVGTIDLESVAMENGDYDIQDTKWTVHAGVTLKEETEHYARGKKVSVRALSAIKDILNNAILFDTEVSVRDSKNKALGTALMHKLYTPIVYGGKTYIAKVSVEEFLDTSTNEIKRKAYHLKGIKIETADGRAIEGNPTTSTSRSDTVSIKSISDLFNLVKTYDKEFNPKEPSKVVNADGTPKIVYHQTGADFNIFDVKHKGAGTSDSDTPFGIFLKPTDEDIGLNGKKQMALYAVIKNPMEADNRSDLISKLKNLSEEYRNISKEIDEMNRNYSERKHTADKAVSEYLVEWRSKNPDASRTAIYEDARYNELSDEQDRIIEEWESADAELSKRAKEVLTNALKKAEYDGVHLKNDQGSFGRKTETFIALDPTQVKSETYNIGTFDKGNEDIQFSEKDDDTFTRMQEIRLEINEIGKSIKSLEASEEYNALLDKVFSGGAEEIKEYETWLTESGYSELEARRTMLEEELAALKKSFEADAASERAEEERKAIEKSGLSEAEYFRKQAVKEFGYTPFFYDAGYIVPNGKMLNFSGEKGQHFGSRGQDHRAIGVIFANVRGGEAMVKFMGQGNVRIMAESPGIDVSSSVEPTKEQYATIRRFARESAKDGYFFIDFTDSNGHTVGNYEYDGRINPERIVSDIRYYFEHGATKGGTASDLMQFHTMGDEVQFSEKDTGTSAYDIIGEKKALEKRYNKLAADFANYKERVKLDKTLTKGKVIDPKQLEAVARYLVKFADSDYKASELAKILNDLYVDIQDGAMDDSMTSDEMYAKAYEVAKEILSKAKIKIERPALYDKILKDIRSARIAPNDGQKGDAKHRFGEHYVGKFRGRVTIANDGTPLDIKWSEWASKYPSVFDKDIGDAQRLVELYDIYDDLRNAGDVVQEYEKSELLQSLATEIINKAWTVTKFESTADKQNKRIQELNAEHRKAMEELRESYEAKATATNNELELYQKLYGDMWSKRRKAYAKAKELGRKKLARYKENAERKSVIQTITNYAKTLLDWYETNSKDKHIHDSLKGPVKELLLAIDFSSKQLLGMKGTARDKRFTPTKNDISIAEALDHLKKSIDNFEGTDDIIDEMRESELPKRISDLLDTYKENQAAIQSETFVLNMMTSEELKRLRDIIKNVKSVVINANKFHIAHRNANAIQKGEESIAQLDARAKVFEDNKKHFGQDLDILKSKIYWNNLNPYYAFRNMGEAAQGIFEAFMDGDDKFIALSDNVEVFARKTWSSKESKSWRDTYFDFAITKPDGKVARISMNVPQIMSLYCVTKQEDAKKHILHGKEDYSGKGITLTKTKKTNAVVDNIPLTEAQLNEIIGVLDDKSKVGRAKEVADAIQEYMSRVGSQLGNEISMARWGIKSFGIENYFPIRVSRDTVNNGGETPPTPRTKLIALLNASFTHARNNYAQNSAEIGDIFDVFSTHMSDMILYNSYALPLLDMYKWMNFKSVDGTANENSVQRAVVKTFGEAGWDYLQKFLEDVGGTTKTDSRDNIGMKLFRKAKVAKVAAKLKVVALQFTSFIRAGAVMDNKYLLHALHHVPKIKKAQENCGIARRKAKGYYDTDIARSLSENIKHEKSVYDKVIDVSLWGAGAADNVTMGVLWNACELEIRDTRKDIKVGSPEFNEAVGKRLREVIYRTQVVDSLLTRSSNMRSKAGLVKMYTSFASESTLSLNLALDTIVTTQLDAREMGGLKQSLEKNGKYVRKAAIAYATTAAVAAVMEAAFTFLYDYDDDEREDNFGWDVLKNFLLNLSITNKIPFVKEIWNFIQGYSSSNLSAGGIEEIVKFAKEVFKLFQGDANMDRIIKLGLQAGSDVSGIPAYNLIRDFKMIYYNLFGYDE